MSWRQREVNNEGREMKIEHITYDACHVAGPSERSSRGQRNEKRTRSLIGDTSDKMVGSDVSAVSSRPGAGRDSLAVASAAQEAAAIRRKQENNVWRSNSTGKLHDESGASRARKSKTKDVPVRQSSEQRSKDLLETSHPLRHKPNFTEKMLGKFFSSKHSLEPGATNNEATEKERGRRPSSRPPQDHLSFRGPDTELKVPDDRSLRSNSMDKLQHNREAIRLGKLERVVAPNSDTRAEHRTPPRPHGTPRSSLDTTTSKRTSGSARLADYLTSGANALYASRPHSGSGSGSTPATTTTTSKRVSAPETLVDLMSRGVDAVADARREVAGRFKEPFEHLSYAHFRDGAAEAEAESDESFYCRGEVDDEGDSMRAYLGSERSLLVSRARRRSQPLRDLSSGEGDVCVENLARERSREELLRRQSEGEQIWETYSLPACRTCDRTVCAAGGGLCRECKIKYGRERAPTDDLSAEASSASGSESSWTSRYEDGGSDESSSGRGAGKVREKLTSRSSCDVEGGEHKDGNEGLGWEKYDQIVRAEKARMENDGVERDTAFYAHYDDLLRREEEKGND